MSKTPRGASQQGDARRSGNNSDQALRWLLLAVGAVVMFGLGRWTADSSRLRELEGSQQALQQQMAALAGGAGTPGATTPAAAPTPVQTLKTGINLEVAGMPSLGEASAPVTFIEFSDFQCPFCGRYVSETLPQIKSTYVDTGKIRYVFRHFPIDSLHKQAVGSARAAACAQAQDRFWPMHDLLFANQQAQAATQLAGYARSVGLDMSAYQSCVDGPAVSVVAADLDAGARGGVMGTPAFFIGTAQPNGTVRVMTTVYGAKPFDVFQTAIETALTAARAGRPNP